MSCQKFGVNSRAFTDEVKIIEGLRRSDAKLFPRRGIKGSWAASRRRRRRSSLDFEFPGANLQLSPPTSEGETSHNSSFSVPSTSHSHQLFSKAKEAFSRVLMGVCIGSCYRGSVETTTKVIKLLSTTSAVPKCKRGVQSGSNDCLLWFVAQRKGQSTTKVIKRFHPHIRCFQKPKITSSCIFKPRPIT